MHNLARTFSLANWTAGDSICALEIRCAVELDPMWANLACESYQIIKELISSDWINGFHSISNRHDVDKGHVSDMLPYLISPKTNQLKASRKSRSSRFTTETIFSVFVPNDLFFFVFMLCKYKKKLWIFPKSHANGLGSIIIPRKKIFGSSKQLGMGRNVHRGNDPQRVWYCTYNNFGFRSLNIFFGWISARPLLFDEL